MNTLLFTPNNLVQTVRYRPSFSNCEFIIKFGG